MAGKTYYSSYDTAAPVLVPADVRPYVPEGALMKKNLLRNRAAVEEAAEAEAFLPMLLHLKPMEALLLKSRL